MTDPLRIDTCQAQEDAEKYVHTVPDHCDRIVWRGRYYGIAELAQWRTWGVIEIANRNVNVSSYVEEKEKRLAVAEPDAERLDLVIRRMTGKAWREIGVIYSDGSPAGVRAAIDAAKGKP